ncbi:hypothetical protein A0H81_14127 [Grifola frondosa]|uniref:Extracellular membrane protein CFEM domain-containing protein n=1 Tax=Grifola frondosa TaxID=5627 RepID=A0A1C7LMM9_GRIFR|nr:hypothetical protein A0H81_14127 [Grifola frondosa]
MLPLPLIVLLSCTLSPASAQSHTVSLIPTTPSPSGTTNSTSSTLTGNASSTSSSLGSSTAATSTTTANFPSLSGYSDCVNSCLALAISDVGCNSIVDVNCYCANSTRFASGIRLLVLPRTDVLIHVLIYLLILFHDEVVEHFRSDILRVEYYVVGFGCIKLDGVPAPILRLLCIGPLDSEWPSRLRSLLHCSGWSSGDEISVPLRFGLVALFPSYPRSLHCLLFSHCR